MGAIDRRQRAPFSHNYPTMPHAFHHVHPCRTQLLCPGRERAIQSMTAGWDPKLCKSLDRRRFLTPSPRNVHTYARLHTSSLLYRKDASGHRNLGSDHYQHFQHFSALVHFREVESPRNSVCLAEWQVSSALSPVKRARPGISVSGDVSGNGISVSLE